MIIQDFLKLITKGEIKSLAISDVGDFTAVNTPEQDENIEEITGDINLGLTELYKRFNIHMGDITYIHTVSGTEYDLPTDFLHMMSAKLPNGIPISINSSNVISKNDLYIPALNLVTVSPYKIRIDGLTPDEGEDLTNILVDYRVAPGIITGVATEIPLTSVFIQCLLDYVAYRSFIGVEASGETEDNIYYLRFESSVKKVSQLGMVIPKETINNKLDIRGYA